MSEARVGPLKVVSFFYEIRDQRRAVVEKPDLPVSYLHAGRGDIFPQVEKALEGHAVGDTVEVTLSPEDAFGPHLDELTFSDDLANVPPEYRRIGAEVEMRNDLGEVKTFVVSKIEDGRLTLDGNHALAGKVLTFVVTLVSIRDASPQEVAQGAPADAMSKAGPGVH